MASWSDGGQIGPHISVAKACGSPWMQGVTGGDKGLQGVAKDYRNIFFKLDRSQIVFLGLFCIKMKVEEIFNFRSIRRTNPFGKILILHFS